MTNEEIEKKAAFLADCLNVPDEREYLNRMLRVLIAQAYEDAAQIAEQVEKEHDEWAEREGLPLDHGGSPVYAERIRALKDSLVQESVSST
jgi:hypothetical protein